MPRTTYTTMLLLSCLALCCACSQDTSPTQHSDTTPQAHTFDVRYIELDPIVHAISWTMTCDDGTHYNQHTPLFIPPLSKQTSPTALRTTHNPTDSPYHERTLRTYSNIPNTQCIFTATAHHNDNTPISDCTTHIEHVNTPHDTHTLILFDCYNGSECIAQNAPQHR